MEAVLRPSLRLCRNAVLRQSGAPLSAATFFTASHTQPKWTPVAVPVWNVRYLSVGPSPDGVLAEVLSFPALSPTMTSGTIAAWKAKPGDSLGPGDSLCEIETDKATVDFEVTDDMVLAEILIPDGSADVEVGAAVALVVEDEDAYNEFVAKGYRLDEGATLGSGSPPASESAPSSPAAESVPSASARVPSIKFLGKRSTGPPEPIKARHPNAKQAATATATPPPPPPPPIRQGNLDLRAPPAATTASPSPAKAQAAPLASGFEPVDDEGRDFVDFPNTNMRKVIASRLTSSKGDTPHFYTRTTCVIDNLLQLRKNLAALGVKVSVNDLIVKCNALALRDVKLCNSSFDEKTNTVKANNTVDISIAVATPNGLITPIIKNADVKGLGAISADAKDLALRARDNKLKLEEFQGGTFTISNMGMFGIREFTSIINTPQSCIMAVGTGKKVFVANGGPDDLATETQMVVSLSCDRRVVDEEVAAVYLKTFQTYVNNPEMLMA